jgi:flagellin
MTTVINTNVPAIVAKSNMDRVQRELENSIAKLSSGKRINKAADDASGMSIANRMESQIRGLTMAIRHAKDGQNLVDTADGAQIEISNMLQRMRELAVQAASDTLDTQNRTFLNAEATALKDEIDRISEQTTWNNLNLLDGTFTGKVFQVGFKGGQTIDVNIDEAATTGLGAYVMNTQSHADTLTANNLNDLQAATLTLSGYLGSATVTLAADATTVNNSVKKVAADVNAVKDSTGIEATAITKGKISGVSLAGKISFDLVGNHTAGAAATSYDVTATLAAKTDLDPLVDAINAHAANTGITAVLGSAASEIILTHQTGETIEISALKVNNSTDGTMVLTALDKFGNDIQTKDTTLGRAKNSATAKITLGNQATTGVKARGHVLGQMTLNSIKSFTVTGDDSTDEQGLFYTTHSYTGQTSAGGTAQLSAVSSISVATQEHASDAISVLDAAIAKIDQQRADLGAISNRLSSVVDNNTSMVTNTEASKSHILDTDFAVETTKLTRTQILQQAATSMLAQANASKQSVLALLQNLG